MQNVVITVVVKNIIGREKCEYVKQIKWIVCPLPLREERPLTDIPGACYMHALTK
jgi:hypothetical protein